MSNFMKVSPVEAEFFHADRRRYGWTDGQTEGQTGGQTFRLSAPEGRTDRQTDWRTDRQKDGRTEMIKLIIAFCNFSKSPKKVFETVSFVFH
jgi:hypothetical protein